MMTVQEIHESLDKMLTDAKTKNFLNHLVRAYFPISNVDKVWEKPKGNFKCVLTKENLFSAQDILQGIQTEEFKNDFMENLKSIFSDGPKSEHPIAKLVGDKKMGVTGKDTTTFMSYPAMQEFYNWVITKSLKGDKHINWLLSSVRRSEFMERAESIEDTEVQNKVQKMKKSTNQGNGFKLGELDSFKQLREKFKN